MVQLSLSGGTWVMQLSLRGVGAAWPVDSGRNSGVRSADPRGAGPSPRSAGGALSLRLAHCSRPSPAPFSSVKQEQLSPRGQAGPPESLGVPTAQETSVLRGEAMAESVEARVCPVSQQLPLCPWRVEVAWALHPDPAGESRGWAGSQTPCSPCVPVFQGRPWARFPEGASARACPAPGCPPRAPSPTAAPSPT